MGNVGGPLRVSCGRPDMRSPDGWIQHYIVAPGGKCRDTPRGCPVGGCPAGGCPVGGCPICGRLVCRCPVVGVPVHGYLLTCALSLIH